MEFLLYFIIWAVFMGVTVNIGSKRTIGGELTFLWSLLLSPLIGLIIAMCYPSIEDEKFKEKSIELQEKTSASVASVNIISELSKLKELFDTGVINQSELEELKSKLLSANITENKKIENNKESISIDDITYEEQGNEIIFSTGKRGFVNKIMSGYSIKTDRGVKDFYDKETAIRQLLKDLHNQS